jgi:hypothetical protein
MELTTINAIIAGVVGLIAGAIGSLIAPWVQWGVEKCRKKHERRVGLIQRCREILSQENFSRSTLLNDPIYGALRGLLDEKVLKEIERPANHFVVSVNSPTSNSDRDLVLREIAKIEKSWDLI